MKELALFKHKIKEQVRFADVDSFGVVHNIKYFYWLEEARTEYIKNLGIKFTPTTFLKEVPLMVVHHDIDYLNSAVFDENIEILSRIKLVKNSSVLVENLVLSLDKQCVLAKASCVMVHMDVKAGTSSPIPEELVEKIRNFEGEDLIIDRN